MLTVVFGFSRPAAAESCDDKLQAGRQSWGPNHAWLASVLHNEAAGVSDAWCRIFETTNGADRISKVEDFGRELFTGEGLHPAVGSIVPGGGLAAGGVLNLERASVSKPLRFIGSAEGRRSASG